MTIEEILSYLDEHPDTVIPWRADGVHSWRGSYDQLGMSRDMESTCTAAELALWFRDKAVGALVSGHKGGEYCIDDDANVHFTEGDWDLGEYFDEAALSELLSCPVDTGRPDVRFMEWIERDAGLVETKLEHAVKEGWGSREEAVQWAEGADVPKQVRREIKRSGMPSDWQMLLLKMVRERGDSDPQLQTVAEHLIYWLLY